MKTSVILALFGFVFAVGFSVALTENELAEIADEYGAGKTSRVGCITRITGNDNCSYKMD